MKKIFLFVCVKYYLTCLTAAIRIRSNRVRCGFLGFFTNLTDLTAKKENSFIYLFFLRSYSCFYWSNRSNRSKNKVFCGVAGFCVSVKFFCCGQKPRLCAAFIGQTVLTLFICVNCYKLGVILFLSTLCVSLLRLCVLPSIYFCQAFRQTMNTRGRG